MEWMAAPKFQMMLRGHPAWDLIPASDHRLPSQSPPVRSRPRPRIPPPQPRRGTTGGAGVVRPGQEASAAAPTDRSGHPCQATQTSGYRRRHPPGPSTAAERTADEERAEGLLIGSGEEERGGRTLRRTKRGRIAVARLLVSPRSDG